MLRQQLAVRRCHESVPPPERQDGGPAAFDPAHMLLQYLGFDAAELRLAALLEDLGRRWLFRGFDLVVEIKELPAQSIGQDGPRSFCPSP